MSDNRKHSLVQIAGVTMRVVEDESMTLGKVALVNDRGHGFAVEDGEIVPCIVPPPPLLRSERAE